LSPFNLFALPLGVVHKWRRLFRERGSYVYENFVIEVGRDCLLLDIIYELISSLPNWLNLFAWISTFICYTINLFPLFELIILCCNQLWWIQKLSNADAGGFIEYTKYSFNIFIFSIWTSILCWSADCNCEKNLNEIFYGASM